MQQHFTRASDGTELAYRIQGEGPTIVLTNGLSASDFYWTPMLQHLNNRYRFVSWDLKGHGASGPARSSQAVSVESSVDDLRRVLAAAGVDQAVFAGFSLGCQIVIEAYRQMPQKFLGLVNVLGTYGHPFDQLLHPRLGPALFALLLTTPRTPDCSNTPSLLPSACTVLSSNACTTRPSPRRSGNKEFAFPLINLRGVAPSRGCALVEGATATPSRLRSTKEPVYWDDGTRRTLKKVP